MMTTPAVSIERRMGQRFPFTLPISLRDHATAAEGLGFTQDVSSRGAFFFTDMPLNAGAEIELTLKMPSEITLGETMRVRCKGQVLRVVNPRLRSDQPRQKLAWLCASVTTNTFPKPRTLLPISAASQRCMEPTRVIAQHRRSPARAVRFINHSSEGKLVGRYRYH